MENVQKIDALRAKIDAKRPLSASLERAVREKLRIDWTYNSNAIEGNTLTLGETAFYLREGLTSEGKPLQDYLEAKNHAEAIDYLYDALTTNRSFTESFVKALHGVLMKGVNDLVVQGGHGQLVQKKVNVGGYKTQPNHVVTLSGEVHTYTDPLHVQEEVAALLQWVVDAKDMHAVNRAAEFHYRFVAIHPFDDGNGRMSRLLMNLILMRDGFLPCVVRNEKRRQYLEVLERVDASGEIDGFVNFIAEELLATYEKIVAVLDGEKNADTEKQQLLATREQREEAVVGVLEQSASPLSISQIHEKLPELKRPTLKKDLQHLVHGGTIKKNGTGKGTTYSL